jgi:hypothetical protein
MKLGRGKIQDKFPKLERAISGRLREGAELPEQWLLSWRGAHASARRQALHVLQQSLKMM